MRNIEFRAWHKTDEVMMRVDALFLEPTSNEFGAGILDEHNDFHSMDEIELMQHTGITDANKNKIFEGDLLRYPANNAYDEKTYVLFEVFYHDNSAAANHVGFQMNRLHFFGNIAGYSGLETFLPKYTEMLVIAGNIHQHSELLETK